MEKSLSACGESLVTPPSFGDRFRSRGWAGAARACPFSLVCTRSGVNDRFRVCFRWTEGGAEDVEIVDYH